MKKQLEEFTAEKKKTETVSIFEEKKKIKNYFYIYFGISVLITLGGVAGIEGNADKYKLIALFMAIVGFESTVLMKLWYHNKFNLIAIMEELKQTELRILEAIEKREGQTQ
ncbi:MAG: hypothetical protein FJ263_02550 [Planctomycetes bacterium]|nr:hypothetical protein [Planctomycetota bacterium]